MNWQQWEQWADKTIPEPAAGVILQKRNYKLKDIARQCRETFKAKNGEVKEFARAFPPTLNGLQMLFEFCDHFFSYKADTAFNAKGEEIPVQALQSPAALWKYKNGDCKSYTVFIQSVINHMGLPGCMLLVDYGNPTEKHIYPNAEINGRRIPLDVVYKKQQGGRFGTEKQPFKMIEKIITKPGLYTVGAIKKTVQPTDLKRYAAQIRAKFPQPAGEDITTMTAGEFDRWQLAQRLKAFDKHESDPKLKATYRAGIKALQTASISGIGELADTDFGRQLNEFIEKTARDNKPAFSNPQIALPPIEGATVEGLGSWIKKQAGKVANAVKDVAGAVAGAFKSLANVFHKGNAKVAGPFFLFAFLPAAALVRASSKVKKKHADQQKMLSYMEKKGKLGSKGQILTSMATGIKEQYGVMPEQILEAAQTQGVGAIPLAAKAATAIASNPQSIGKAINVLKGIGSAIISIFKKKDRDDEEFDRLSNEAASDLALLYNDDGSLINPTTTTVPAKNIQENNTDTTNTNAGSGNNMGMWIGLAAAAAAVVVIAKK